MMKTKTRVLFLTNYPSPYRVDFFNLLGEQVDLTVAFTEKPEAQKHRSREWFNSDYSGFKAIFLKQKMKIGRFVFKDIFPLLRSKFDYIILGGYTSGTQMIAIEYMRFHRIPFAIEADGGLLQNEKKITTIIKKHFISSASAWLSSGRTTTDYFLHYGANKEKVVWYPFTSQWENEINAARTNASRLKTELKSDLGIYESKMIMTVGQMIYRKGIDILLQVAKKLPDDVAVVIIGGEPTEEYIQQIKKYELNHVYFLGFKSKTELASYYRAADLFVMPTRYDIWGLVINEAMSYGLPIVSTDHCGAALELVENYVNGIIVPVDNPDEMIKAIIYILKTKPETMGKKSIEKIKEYSIENMVKVHIDFLHKCMIPK